MERAEKQHFCWWVLLLLVEYTDKTNTAESLTLPWSHCEKSCLASRDAPAAAWKLQLVQPDPSELLQALRRRNISKAINQTQAQEGEGSSAEPRQGHGQAAVGPAEHQCPAGTANVTRGHSHELPVGREGWLWSSFALGIALGEGGGCCCGLLEPSAKTSCIPQEHRTAVKGKTNSPHIPPSLLHCWEFDFFGRFHTRAFIT